MEADPQARFSTKRRTLIGCENYSGSRETDLPRVIDRRDSISPRIMKFSGENGTISRPCDPLSHSIRVAPNLDSTRRDEITWMDRNLGHLEFEILFFFFSCFSSFFLFIGENVDRF